jgi:hypothetical protein
LPTALREHAQSIGDEVRRILAIEVERMAAGCTQGARESFKKLEGLFFRFFCDLLAITSIFSATILQLAKNLSRF